MEKSISSELYKTVISALVELRKGAGLTQRDLASRLKREPSFIAKLELGERRVDVLEFFRIAKACGQVPSKASERLMKQLEILDKNRRKTAAKS